MDAAINWGTVQTAAATALLVTLAVEYFAKPVLEARKEGHLEKIRARRHLRASIISLTLAAQVVVSSETDLVGVDRRVTENLRVERTRNYDRMRATSVELFDDAGRYLAAFRWWNRRLLTDYLVTLHGLMMSVRSKGDQGRIVMSMAVPVSYMIEQGPWNLWWWVGRYRLRRLVERAQSGQRKPPEGQSS